MNVTGWEIKPLGCIALALAAVIALYVYVTLRNGNRPKESKI